VVVALSDLPDEEMVLNTAAEAATYTGSALSVRHAVPVSFGPRSVGLGDAVDHGHLLLAAAHDQLATAHLALPVVTELRRMWAHELVGEGVDADLLVIGGPRLNSDRGPGLIARSAIHHAFCPLLLVPRPPGGALMHRTRPRSRTRSFAVRV
jgi:nucleotide-binding universal stress UspA family protein